MWETILGSVLSYKTTLALPSWLLKVPIMKREKAISWTQYLDTAKAYTQDFMKETDEERHAVALGRKIMSLFLQNESALVESNQFKVQARFAKSELNEQASLILNPIHADPTYVEGIIYQD